MIPLSAAWQCPLLRLIKHRWCICLSPSLCSASSATFFQGFGVLTLPYDIVRLVFLLFVLLSAHYWMHHGMICFVNGFVFWMVFLCHNFFKYSLSVSSTGIAQVHVKPPFVFWILGPLLCTPIFWGSRGFPTYAVLSPAAPAVTPLCIHCFLAPLAPLLQNSYASSQIVYVPFRVRCTLRLLLIFLIKTLL